MDLTSSNVAKQNLHLPWTFFLECAVGPHRPWHLLVAACSGWAELAC